MKSNIVKLLAMSSLVLSLNACSLFQKKDSSSSGADTSSSSEEPDVPVELTFAELTNLVDGGKYEYEGKLAIIKDAAVYGVYDNGASLTINAPYSEGQTSVGGAEVHLAAAHNFEQITRGLGAKVSVQGRVIDEKGHVALADAELLACDERVYVEGKRQQGTGADMTIWSLNDPQRENFDKLGKTDSALNWNFADMELCSLPEEYDGSEAVEFYVCFPGENPFYDDDFNFDTIKTTIPKGVHPDFIDAINGFFADCQVGDQIGMYVTSYYDGEIQFLLHPAWTFWDDVFVPAEDPIDVVRTYEEATAPFEDKYVTPMPNLEEDDLVYRVDVANLWAAKIADISGFDASFVDESLLEEGGLVIVDLMTRYDHCEDLLDDLVAQLEELGYEEKAGGTATKAVLELKEDDQVVADLKLVVASDEEETHFCVELQYVAIRTVTSEDFNTFMAAVAAYQAKINPGFVSGLVDLPAEPATTGTTLSWVNLETYDGASTYEFKLQFAEGAFADNDAWEAYGEAYEALLVEAGFDDKGMYLVNQGYITGLLNTTSGEFAFLDFETDLNDDITGLTLTVMHIEVENDYFFSTSDAFVWTDLSAAAFVGHMWTQTTGRVYAPKAGVGYYYMQMGAYYSTNKQAIFEYATECIPACAVYQGNRHNDDYALTEYYFALNTKNEADTVVVELDVGDDIGEGEEAYFSMTLYTFYDE